MNRNLFKELFRGMLLVVFSPILVIWALADRHGQALEFWSFKVVNSGFEIGNSVRELWRFFVGVVKLAGWITIVILVATAITTLLYLVLHEAGVSWPLMQPYYPIAAKIFENRVAWAAISTVLGAMVAISHLKNLEINQIKFEQEQADRARKIEAAHEEQRKKRLSRDA